jgi:hypothetical protein
MHLEGTYAIQAPLLRVWDFISNPEQIGGCLPGLESLHVRNSRSFTVTVKMGIAFIKGTFKFDFTLLEENPPSHSKFQGVGKGAGFSVNLTATIDLKELGPSSTELGWKTDATLGGLVGELSPSLLQSTTTSFSEEFFACVKRKLEA